MTTLDSLAKNVPDVEEQPEITLDQASQWRLMWWKFRKHRLAMCGGIVVIFFYIMAIFAEFFAPVPVDAYNSQYVYAPPQQIHLFRDGGFAPFVYGYRFEQDPRSLKRTFFVNEEDIIPIGLFVRGQPYTLFGLIESDIHLVGPLNEGDPFYLFGSDKSGRDVFSRTVFSSRISLSIGLIGVFIGMGLGIVIGGISGLIGGFTDNVIQRLIEVFISIPMLPVIIAVAAMVPIDWPITRVYLIITILLSFTSWTGIARVVRSKFLAVREEDYVLAARLDGARTRRLIVRHMLPSFYSHLIASLTLAIPGMIIGETALSFLGVGLREPVVSWGVQLQGTQSIAVIANHGWLLSPAIAVIIVVLAFNFLGDGLRDAADPY